MRCAVVPVACLSGLFLVVGVVLCGCGGGAAADGTDAAVREPAAPVAEAESPPAEGEWRWLLQGEGMGNFHSTNFGGEGDVRVEDGRVVMTRGNDMTGITWNDPVPPFTTNYEIELEARREEGSDFFCALTFPVGEDFCSLICGGWGGGVTGLSSLGGYDASENDTSRWVNYENGRWYKLRVRVTPVQIEVWLDDEQIVDADIDYRSVDTRVEVYGSRPLGIATWRTTGAVRNMRWRPVDGPDSL